MKLQNGAQQIDIASIWIDRENRQRREIKTDDLEASIGKRGLLNAILVTSCDLEGFPWELKAGERRLTACRNLGHQKILARKVSDLSPAEAQILELEENVKRSDLEWPELCKSIATIHRLYCELDPGWTMGETADECAVSLSLVSLYLSVHAKGWAQDGTILEQRIADAGTVREAHNMIQRRDQRHAGAALQELLDGPDAAMAPAIKPEDQLTEEDRQQIAALSQLSQPLPPELARKAIIRATAAANPPQPPESILNLSFLDWAPQYTGPKFNFIHCDFPYGVELFSGPQGRGAELGQENRLGYKDSADTYKLLLAGLCHNLDRVMSISAHLMFWLSADLEIIWRTREYFREHAPSLKFTKFPLIWVKSDNAGIASDPKHGPRHVYEACLLASRGNRNIARVKGDAYSAPTDKRLHPSTKPEPVLRHFMEMLVDETTAMLDPTCGSASSLRAAESLGAGRVLGLEIDRQFVGPAQLALKQARQKRAAEKAGGGGFGL